MSRRALWAMLVVANVLFYCVLSFYGTSDAAQMRGKPAKEPFANSVQQRADMIAQLREIKTLLKEQNALLRSGKLKVVIEESK